MPKTGENQKQKQLELDIETFPQNISTEQPTTEPYGPGSMEDQLLHLLEILKTSAKNWNRVDPQPVTETKIREIIHEEVDERILHIVRNLEIRLTVLNEDRKLYLIMELEREMNRKGVITLK